MIKVLWTKEFITGNLKDLFIDSEISCADMAEANAWVMILTGKPMDTLEGTQYIAHQARVTINGALYNSSTTVQSDAGINH